MSVIDNALQVLFNMAHPPTLWTNASPASNFAGQKIALNLSGKKGVEVLFAFSTAGGRLSSVQAAVGESGNKTCGYLGSQGNSNYETKRTFAVDSTGVTFSDGQRKYNGTYDAPDVINQYIIPLEIRELT